MNMFYECHTRKSLLNASASQQIYWSIHDWLGELWSALDMKPISLVTSLKVPIKQLQWMCNVGFVPYILKYFLGIAFLALLGLLFMIWIIDIGNVITQCLDFSCCCFFFITYMSWFYINMTQQIYVIVLFWSKRMRITLYINTLLDPFLSSWTWILGAAYGVISVESQSPLCTVTFVIGLRVKNARKRIFQVDLQNTN